MERARNHRELWKMKEKRWKTSENNWKIDENFWKNNEKARNPTPNQKKNAKNKSQLNSAPFWISFSTFLAFQHFLIGLIATLLNLLS